MAPLRLLAVILLAGCGELQDFGGPPSPLARVQVQIPGDVGGLPPLHVALVWGQQWLPEPFCILPAESSAAAAVIAEGCPDPFGFVPRRVAASTPLTPGTPATLELFALPAADVMVGDVAARVAYGSLVVYEDRNGSGTLELRNNVRQGEDAGPVTSGPGDVVYGASFVSMTMPDQRVAFREGAFDSFAAFYPRAGCGEPPRGFAVVAAGGFSFAEALAAAIRGELPPQQPESCWEKALADVVVEIAIDPARAAPVACSRNRASGIPRYREPDDVPNLRGRVWACVGLPNLSPYGGPAPASPMKQLVVASPDDNACKSVNHYTLRGCDDDPTCATPEWDLSATPPPGWPCPP